MNITHSILDPVLLDSVFLDSVFLGAIEGLTEFLPVSSTGHLILFGALLNFNDSAGKIFEVVIQLGAILAVCVLYFKRLWSVLTGLMKRDRAAIHFAVTVLIAFFPAVVLGLVFHDFIKAVLFSPLVVALSLIAGGVVMLAVERRGRPAAIHAIDGITPALAFKIGLAQCVAMIPGVSRSGATIIGALYLGADRKTAAEFSFFLAIPTMFGASALDLWKGRHGLNADSLGIMAIGFITAFIVALAIIRWFIGFISTHDFKPFAWYRIAFGLVILAWLLLR